MDARRFTYGDQFDPDKFSLTEILELCVDSAPDRKTLQTRIMSAYFRNHGLDPASQSENFNKMAMNCVLSLNAYKLIALEGNRNEKYSVTNLCAKLLALRQSPDEVSEEFAIHILSNLEGLVLLRLIENIRARGEQVTLEYLGEEFEELGFKIPPNSTYISTMRKWLEQARIFRPAGYEVNWDVVYDLLKVDEDLIDQLYALTPEQKHFLLSLISLHAIEFTPSNKVASHTRSVFKLRLTTKNLVKEVLAPLEEFGLIQARKTTTGRGAKPHHVRLTEKAQIQLLQPLLANLATLAELTPSELNRPFESVVADLKSLDQHVRGVA